MYSEIMFICCISNSLGRRQIIGNRRKLYKKNFIISIKVLEESEKGEDGNKESGP
jgi:hypothetical protein